MDDPRTVDVGSEVDKAVTRAPAASKVEHASDGVQPSVPGYELLGVLGRGGMGVVYKARQKSLNRIVALKMVLAGAHAGERELKRFRAEAESVARLVHPNIVQIYEVGEQDGLPFFSFEYVDGGSLDKKLAGTPQPAREAAELAEKLARAVQYAHECGIIHRDLKPANILLQGPGARASMSAVRTQGAGVRSEDPGDKTHEMGPSGAAPFSLAADSQSPIPNPKSLVPKITDFGLAKHLQNDMGMTAPGGLTQSGAIVGTPSYMAPEQAGGGAIPVGPAADVYALGAVLYELLTGRPPFQGENAMDIMLLVLSEEPVPPSRLRPRLPADLETICLKCLYKESRKRYGSAEALADDLRRFLDGKPIVARPVGRLERLWRWCVRNPVVAGLLAALFLVIVGGFLAVTSQWLRAESQRELAEENERRADANRKRAEDNLREANTQRKRAEEAFRQAKRAVDDYYTRVSENKLLGVPGMEPLRKDLLEAALKYYQDFVDQNRTDAKIRAELATAYFRLATITELIGSKPRAQEAYRRATDMFEQVVRDEPGNHLCRRRLVVCLNDFGLTLQENGQIDESRKMYSRSRLLGEKLLDDQPNDYSVHSALAKTYLNTAIVSDKEGRTQDAVEFYLKCQHIQENIVYRVPLNSEYKSDLSLTYMNLGSAYLEHGQPQQGLDLYYKTLAIQKELVRQGPDAIYYRRLLGAVYHNIGMLYRLNNRFGDALTAYQESQKIRESLAGDHPSVHDYQNDLGETLNNIGEIELAGRDTRTARATLRRSAEIFQKLAAENATNSKFRNAEALALNNLGVVLHQMGRSAEALDHHQRALAIRTELARANPGVIDFQSHLSDSYCNLANTQRGLGQTDEALRSYREGCAILERLVAKHPTTTKFRVNLGLAYTNTGYLEDARDRLHSALEAFERARAIRSELRATIPSVPRYAADFAQSQFYIAKVLAKQGSNDKALAHYEEALGIQDKLIHNSRLEGLSRPVGVASAAMGRGLLEGLTALLAQPNSLDDPGALDFRADRGRSLIQIGNLHHDSNRFLPAFQWYKKAREEWLAIVAVQPDVAEYLSNLGVSHYNFGLNLQDLRLALAALTAHRAGVAAREKLVREYPDDLDYRRQLAESYNSCGIAELSLRRRPAAEISFQKARDGFKYVLEKEPEKARNLSNLGRALLNVGITLDEADRPKDAEPALRASVPWQRQALDREPYNFRYRDLLNKSLTRLAKAQRKLGRPAEAAATTLARRKLWPTQTGDLTHNAGAHALTPTFNLLLAWFSFGEQLTAAGELAQCIPLVGAGKPRLTLREEIEHARYSALAIEVLRDLAANGYRDAGRLEKDELLAPLRTHADFQKLLADMKGKSPGTRK
jgi:serine/threonine-protein kinase